MPLANTQGGGEAAAPVLSNPAPKADPTTHSRNTFGRHYHRLSEILRTTLAVSRSMRKVFHTPKLSAPSKSYVFDAYTVNLMWGLVFASLVNAFVISWALS